MHLMRPFRAHGLSVLAMLLLLLGTAAPALARMTCVMGGHSVLQVGDAADCCPNDHDHATDELKPTCCEMLQAQPQRTNFVQVSGAMVPVLFGVAVPTAVQPAPAVVSFGFRDVLDARPPPLLLSRRLAAFGTFRI